MARNLPISLLLCALGLTVYPHGALGQSPSATARTAGELAPKDGQHDFDFEFGAWKARISRLTRPLSSSSEWVEYEGTSVVRKIWDGKGNLGELDVQGPAGRITGLSLRLYNPETRQWAISWANARDGALGPPMYGGFANGRGEFYNQELFNGRAILVRFIFSEITPTSFQLEQAFSDDGGKTWEANWVARFTR
ncbi:MAG TPA: hypothetical protein VJ803_06135 [Gemmatimonadaceae bacterium]|nr:hypothetical protein [Gemmatimonadaceae bacterium]